MWPRPSFHLYQSISISIYSSIFIYISIYCRMKAAGCWRAKIWPNRTWLPVSSRTLTWLPSRLTKRLSPTPSSGRQNSAKASSIVSKKSSNMPTRSNSKSKWRRLESEEIYVFDCPFIPQNFFLKAISILMKLGVCVCVCVCVRVCVCARVCLCVV